MASQTSKSKRQPAPPGATHAASPELLGREILICVGGGIAAYKTAMLVSLLVQAGGGVTVAMTHSARRFVGRITFEALTGRPVHSSLWPNRGEVTHLKVGEDAELIVVAPATANLIGKLAGGIADDLISTLLLGAAAPVILAPAMNVRMWQHPSVQRNIRQLEADGVRRVGPNSGWQACRAVGPGRMAEPADIFEAICDLLLRQPRARRGP